MQARQCPTCETTWLSSGWQGPARVRCACGAPLNLAEAQLDRQLLDQCAEIAAELMEELGRSGSGK
jgi:hypothetical protein